MWLQASDQRALNERWHLNKDMKVREGLWYARARPKGHFKFYHFSFLHNLIILHSVSLLILVDCGVIGPQLCSMVQPWHPVVPAHKWPAEWMGLGLSIRPAWHWGYNHPGDGPLHLLKSSPPLDQHGRVPLPVPFQVNLNQKNDK